MGVSLLFAALVALYVAYPHRGEKIPAVPWLGEAMGRAVRRAPVLDEVEGEVLRQGWVVGAD
ncbi:hypothetical protein [Nocardioides sp. YIM 152588]|uniref:hypothetical protein n=1 Tax=Nocardioides sp. YIM 152588 TaxID=3158259 RepID=UPI0032E4D920